MTRPNENALTPASLATDGEQGEGATANRCHANDTGQPRHLLMAVREALLEACRWLSLYSVVTDEPELGVVEAADLLDAARAALDGDA